MDIFSRIDDEQQIITRALDLNIVESEGRYGFLFVRDESKIDTEFCEYISVDKAKRYSKTGYFIRKRTEKFYKLLSNTQKQNKNPAQQQKEQQERLKKIKKMLDKGVNMSEYFSLKMDRTLLKYLTEDELKMLYLYGFDIAYTLVSSSEMACYRKNIYFAFENLDRVEILKNMPVEILEKIIHTRNGVKISRELADSLVEGRYYYYSKGLLENVQLLFKLGQVQFTANQIAVLYEASKNNNARIFPEIQAIFDFLKVQGKITGENQATKKRTYQTRQETKKSKQNDAQEIINKLFEDAQNSVK